MGILFLIYAQYRFDAIFLYFSYGKHKHIMITNLPKILLVDDIEVNLILLETALRKEQASLHKATSGHEALRITENTEFALIILDVSMPVMNGFELAELIRKQQLNTLTPIIFISAIHFDEFSVSQGYRSGAVDYISKPYHHEVLLSKVRVFLQLFNQKQELLLQSQHLQESNNRFQEIQEILRLRLQLQKAVSLASARFSGNFDLISSIHFMLRDIASVCGSSLAVFIPSNKLKPIFYDENQLDSLNPEKQSLTNFPVSIKTLNDSKLKLSKEFNKHQEAVILLSSDGFNGPWHLPYKIDKGEVFSIEAEKENTQTISINVTSGEKHYGYIILLESTSVLSWEASELKALSVFGTITGNALERDETRKHLVASELRYRSYIENAPEGIVITSSKGIIYEYNKAFGLMFPDFIKQEGALNILSILNQYELASPNTKVQNLLNGKFSKCEFVVSSNGKTLLVKTESVKLSADQYLIFCTDITKERELEKHIIQTERMVAIGEMATGIAHEINQPLNTISFGIDNLFQALARGTADANYIKEKNTKIFESIHRMRNIIDHVRNFARGNDDMILTSFNVAEPLDNTLSLFTEQLKNNGIEVIKHLDESTKDAFIHGNTYKIEQVLLNLLSNARDTMLEKMNIVQNYNPVITIKGVITDSKFHLSVTDNGMGIESNQLDHITKPFVTSKAPGKGTGLGLAISQKILNEHNGSIHIQSKKGEGTTVTVKIPVINGTTIKEMPSSKQTTKHE